MVKKFYVVIPLFIFLSACVQQPPLQRVDNWNEYQRSLAAVADWQLRGKLSIKVPGDAVKPSIHWQQQSMDYEIRLWGAFGQGTTRVVGDNNSVRLERAGEEPITSDNAEQLIYDALGYHIPVEDLQFWVRGIPAPQQAITDERLFASNEQNQGMLQSLRQSGWQLSYDSYQRHGRWNLPNRIDAVRGDLQISLRVSEWTIAE